MHEQNSLSNLNTPTAKDTIISSGAVPAFNPVSSPAPKAKRHLDIKTILIALVGALLGAGVTLGIIFLVNKIKDNSSRVEVYDADTVSDGTITVEETVSKFDDQISAAKDQTEELDALLGKIGYYIIMENYDQALADLSTISLNSLSDYDQYRVYSNFANVYAGLGNAAKSAEYKQLAEAASSRDFDSQAE